MKKPDDDLLKSVVGWRPFAIVVVVFVVLNVCLIILAPPEKHVSGDAIGYLDIAHAFLEYGALVEPDDPTQPLSSRQPLYPAFLASVMWLSGSESLIPIIVVQAAILFIVGILVYRVAGHWCPGYELLALALVIFNPNALSITHYLYTENLFTLWYVAAGYSLLSFSGRQSYKKAICIGLFIGLAALTRPEAKLLIPLIPVALLLVTLVSCGKWLWRRLLLDAAVSLGAALLVVLPLSMSYLNTGAGLRVSSGEKAAAMMSRAVLVLEMHSSNISREEATELIVRERRTLIQTDPRFLTASIGERNDLLYQHFMQRLWSFEPNAFARALIPAWIGFFVSGGAQRINHMLEIPHQRVDKFLNRLNSWDILKKSVLENPPLGVVVVVVCFGIAVVLRFLGLVGYLTIISRHHWPLLLVVTGAILFKVSVHLFYGQSRYRVPVDPYLILLAVFGIDALRYQYQMWRARYYTSFNSSEKTNV